ERDEDENQHAGDVWPAVDGPKTQADQRHEADQEDGLSPPQHRPCAILLFAGTTGGGPVGLQRLVELFRTRYDLEADLAWGIVRRAMGDFKAPWWAEAVHAGDDGVGDRPDGHVTERRQIDPPQQWVVDAGHPALEEKAGVGQEDAAAAEERQDIPGAR